MRYLFLLLGAIVFITGCSHLQQSSGLTTYAEGVLYEKANNTEEAINLYKKTLMYGESSYVYQKLGSLYLKEKNTKEAKRCFFRALKLDPKNSDALFNLGVLYILEDTQQLASSYITKGLALKPDNQTARMILSDILVALNELDKASEEYQILLEAFPNNYLLLYNQGNLFEKMGMFDEAEKAYLSSISTASNFWKGTLALALLYNKQNKDDEALKYFHKSVRLNPQDNISYSFLISHYYRIKDNQRVKSLIMEALRNGIQNIEFYNLLGVVYSEEEDYLKAAEIFKASIKVKDSSAARFYLGIMYDKLEMPDKMMEEMKQSISIEPNNALALNYLGYSYLVQDINLQEALTLIQRACKLDPENGAFLDSLGWAYYKHGKYRQASKYLNKAATLEKDAEVYEHLGHLYLVLKEYDRSLLWFVKSYEISNNRELLDKIDEVKKRIRNENN